MDLGLTDRVAVVTGAARGIGFAIARGLATEGARVVVSDVDAVAARDAAEKLRADGLVAEPVAADVTDPGQVQALVDATLERFGGLGVLVNNAGFQRDGRLSSMSDDDWDAVLGVVLKAAFLTTRAVVPHMAERGWGRIVNISSRAHFGNPGQANYSAAKAGLIGLTKSQAQEQGKRGITVNAVAPGLVETEAVRAHRAFDTIKERAISTTPLARTGLPEDIANAVAFLASDRASFVTGELLHVTGGRFG